VQAKRPEFTGERVSTYDLLDTALRAARATDCAAPMRPCASATVATAAKFALVCATWTSPHCPLVFRHFFCEPSADHPRYEAINLVIVPGVMGRGALIVLHLILLIASLSTRSGVLSLHTPAPHLT